VTYVKIDRSNWDIETKLLVSRQTSYKKIRYLILMLLLITACKVMHVVAAAA